jgi:hypothetical protein
MTDWDVQGELEECYHLMYRGMVEKDQAALEKVLAPEFVLIHMTGIRQSKKEFIRSVMDGTLHYVWARHQKVLLSEVKDDQAELIGQSLVHAAVFGGGFHTWRLQLVCRLVKRDTGWQIKEARASTY